MMVVPESMIVSKPLTIVLPPDLMEAPVICQNPVEVSTLWNSILPVYKLLLAPPR